MKCTWTNYALIWADAKSMDLSPKCLESGGDYCPRQDRRERDTNQTAEAHWHVDLRLWEIPMLGRTLG